MMTQDEAFKRAVMWLGVLIQYAEIEPQDTSIRIRALRDGSGDVLAHVNLAEDLEAFRALGANPDVFTNPSEEEL